MTFDASILAWLALAAAVTVSPGPDTLLVTSHAARGGVRAGLAATAGVISGGVWYALLCGFGFLGVLSASPVAYAVVKTAGAIYLAWIGARMLFDAWRGKAHAESAKAPSLGAPFRQGLLTNVLNPKVAVFYLAVLPQFVGAGPDAGTKGALLIAIHYVLGALWLSLMAIATGRLRAAFARSSVRRWFDGVLGAALIAVAGRLAFERR